MSEIAIAIATIVLSFILILIIDPVIGALVGAFIGWLLGYTPLAPPVLKVWQSLTGTPCALWELGMFIGFAVGLVRAIIFILCNGGGDE